MTLRVQVISTSAVHFIDCGNMCCFFIFLEVVNMIDIIQLRKTYNVLDRMSLGKHPFAEEELTWEVANSRPVKQSLADAARIIAVYGNLLNVVTQSTNFKVYTLGRAGQQAFHVDREDAKSIAVASNSILITRLAKNINDCVGRESMRSITAVDLGKWLVQEGFLEIKDKQKNKVATAKGVELGIITKERIRENGENYFFNRYTPKAQRYIIDHLPEISEFLQGKVYAPDYANEEGEEV